MIFIVHPDKTVTTLLEQVTVGDTTTDIVVISPFSDARSCTLKYRLPDGEESEPQFLKHMGTGASLGIGYEGSVYTMKISQLMTEFMGTVRVTIVFTDANAKEFVCEAASFTVGCFPSFFFPADTAENADFSAQIKEMQTTIEQSILPMLDEASGAAAVARDSAQSCAASAQESAAAAQEASVGAQASLRYAGHAESSAAAAQQSAESAALRESQAALYAESYKLPDVTSADDGNYLRVAGGKWTSVSDATSLTAQELENALAAERAKVKFYATPDAEENPAELFGGDWTRIENRFLLGIGDAYPLHDANGALILEGGSADAVVVEHNHEIMATYSTYGTASAESTSVQGVNDYLASYSRTLKTGESGTGKNMPPYYGMYLWRRLTQEEIENASA